jgi:hypothetical protein
MALPGFHPAKTSISNEWKAVLDPPDPPTFQALQRRAAKKRECLPAFTKKPLELKRLLPHRKARVSEECGPARASPSMP